jgi:autotransporter-associated beta strand protein
MGGSGGDITIDSGASAVFGGNSNRAYDGRIRGQGAFKKEGNGILTLNADNDFAGTTRIAQGRLKLGAAGGLSATPQIAIDSGAIFDVADRSGFALGTGQRLGGRGTVLGDLQFGGGSQIAFDPTGPLLVGSGTVSFASGFGIGSIFGLDATVAEGTYTLLNETTGGSISFARSQGCSAFPAICSASSRVRHRARFSSSRTRSCRGCVVSSQRSSAT